MTEAQIRVVDASVKQMELGGVGLEGEVSTDTRVLLVLLPPPLLLVLFLWNTLAVCSCMQLSASCCTVR